MLNTSMILSAEIGFMVALFVVFVISSLRSLQRSFCDLGKAVVSQHSEIATLRTALESEIRARKSEEIKFEQG